MGLGAVIFGDLINDRVKDIESDWDKVLTSQETATFSMPMPICIFESSPGRRDFLLLRRKIRRSSGKGF